MSFALIIAFRLQVSFSHTAAKYFIVTYFLMLIILQEFLFNIHTHFRLQTVF